ncbi:hypothetical protein ACK8P5_25630 (plasmid) [Paenibacillus sp. EC2-1]|uniref:hypothetical protein n=1 Tax=Paenibacillus sp. EC2-1 TaxID=3388665 RepID=UPI003BEF3FF5
MSRFDRTDIALTPDGDLVLENGDLRLARNSEFMAQSVYNRVNTSDPDWIDYLRIDIGANLEDFRGMPNNETTAEKGVLTIGQCLTRDGLVSPEDLYIEPAPFDKRTIAFFVFIKTPNESEPLGFEIRLDLDTGTVIKGV